MNLPVRVSVRAAHDADVIFNWLAEHSREGALRWYETYLSTLRSLPDSAVGSPIAHEGSELGIDLREVLFKTRKGHFYRVLFIVRADAVHVLNVRGPGQDDVTPADLGVPD